MTANLVNNIENLVDKTKVKLEYLGSGNILTVSFLRSRDNYK